MRTLIAAIILTFGIAACDPVEAQRESADPVEMFAPDDAAMNAAIEQARAALPRFWELYGANDGSDFMLKVGFPTPDGGNEHIWVGDLQRTDAGLTAIVMNEPHNVPELRNGARTAIDETLISDWSLTRNGQMYGHYTTRVVVGSLPPEEQAQYAGFLASIAQGVP